MSDLLKNALPQATDPVKEKIEQYSRRIAEEDALRFGLEDAVTKKAIADATNDSQESPQDSLIFLVAAMGKLTGSLSPELCKEDHGLFMLRSAKIEELAVVAETILIGWEAITEKERASIKPTRWFSFTQPKNNPAQLIDLKIETVRKFREQMSKLRKKPAEIHQEAVDHVKRLLLYERKDYQELQNNLAQISKQAQLEQKRDHWSELAKKLNQAGTDLKEALERIDKECADKALQQIQDSDNGSRLPQNKR